MKRKIVTIDEELCIGCGLCINACQEGALKMVDGKARLVSEIYCDGLGDCLPACPTGAIKIEERESKPYDEMAAEARKKAMKSPLAGGCPGTMARAMTPVGSTGEQVSSASSANISPALGNWPVQIKLVPPMAPYLDNAALLIAADCTAFSYPDIHNRFMRGKVTLIGCPKLDEGDYSEKLTAILMQNEIRNVTVLRMEVPCCNGIANAVKQALINSGKMIPWKIVTISIDGKIVDE